MAIESNVVRNNNFRHSNFKEDSHLLKIAFDGDGKPDESEKVFHEKGMNVLLRMRLKVITL